MSAIEQWSRPTIMSGKVVTFAPIKIKETGILPGDHFRAGGCFEVSASRDQVIVHSCSLSNVDQYKLFLEALSKAFDTYLRLKQGG